MFGERHPPYLFYDPLREGDKEKKEADGGVLMVGLIAAIIILFLLYLSLKM